MERPSVESVPSGKALSIATAPHVAENNALPVGRWPGGPQTGALRAHPLEDDTHVRGSSHGSRGTGLNHLRVRQSAGEPRRLLRGGALTQARSARPRVTVGPRESTPRDAQSHRK